jgi:hypothetical protein
VWKVVLGCLEVFMMWFLRVFMEFWWSFFRRKCVWFEENWWKMCLFCWWFRNTQDVWENEVFYCDKIALKFDEVSENFENSLKEFWVNFPGFYRFWGYFPFKIFTPFHSPHPTQHFPTPLHSLPTQINWTCSQFLTQISTPNIKSNTKANDNYVCMVSYVICF